jgi:hypothetical protein
MASPKKFNAETDFVRIGKKLADQTHELEKTVEEGEIYKYRLAESRQDLDIARLDAAEEQISRHHEPPIRFSASLMHPRDTLLLPPLPA